MKFPPEVIHLPNNLDAEATNCYEAAMYRNIHIEQELKTLIFEWNGEFHEFNMLGNREIYLPHNDYRWVSVETLAKLGLAPGIINPFSIHKKMPFIKHVAFCSSIFSLDKVYTNDGTLTGTIIIPTNILLKYFQGADVFLFSKIF